MTELEGVILGIIWSRGPCSGYVVHKRFANSPTSGWSSSTGSIYPALARLEAQGLIAATAPNDGQRGRLLSLTPPGEDALRTWVLAFGDDAGGAVVDPLRARGIYVGILDAEGRREFMDHAERRARAALVSAEAAQLDPKGRDNWGHQAALMGVRFEIEARLKWVEALRRQEATARADEGLAFLSAEAKRA